MSILSDAITALEEKERQQSQNRDTLYYVYFQVDSPTQHHRKIMIPVSANGVVSAIKNARNHILGNINIYLLPGETNLKTIMVSDGKITTEVNDRSDLIGGEDYDEEDDEEEDAQF